jgi:hypothetical protein
VGAQSFYPIDELIVSRQHNTGSIDYDATVNGQMNLLPLHDLETNEPLSDFTKTVARLVAAVKGIEEGSPNESLPPRYLEHLLRNGQPDLQLRILCPSISLSHRCAGRSMRIRGQGAEILRYWRGRLLHIFVVTSLKDPVTCSL